MKLGLICLFSVLALLLVLEGGWDIVKGHRFASVVGFRMLKWTYPAISRDELLAEFGGNSLLISVGLPDAPLRLRRSSGSRPTNGFQNVDLSEIHPYVYQPTPSHLPPLLKWQSVTRRKDTGEILYSVPQSTDSHGRRTTVQAKPKVASWAIATLGCSFAWGDGVRDEETLASRLAAETGVETQNLAVNGGNPATALETVQRTDFAKMFPQKRVLALYPMYADQLNRTYPGVHYMVSFRYQVYYEEVDGKIVRYLNFSVPHPFRAFLFDLLSRSRLLADMGFNIPRSIDQAVLDWNARLMGEIRSELHKKAPGSELVAVMYPGSERGAITRALVRRGIPVMDYSHLDYAPYCADGCILNPFDEHPSAEFNAVFAKALARDLASSHVLDEVHGSWKPFQGAPTQRKPEE